MRLYYSDMAQALRQRRPTLEQQPGAVLDPVEQRIERPADPEILLDVLRRCAEPLRSLRIEARAGGPVSAQDFVEAGVHLPDASATSGRSSSCIHARSVDIPSARLARNAVPCAGLPRRAARRWRHCPASSTDVVRNGRSPFLFRHLGCRYQKKVPLCGCHCYG